MQPLFTRTLPRALYRAEQVRELDRLAIVEHGIAGYTLMSRAAGAALAALQQLWPRARRILVVCGGGNNGGDGYVLARLAHAQGLETTVSALTGVEKLTGDALTAYRDCIDAGLEIRPAGDHPLEYGAAHSDVIVDAIFGTGLQRPVSGHWQTAVNAINRGSAPVLALDLPSGLNADTGCVLGSAIQATATISFIALKPGLFTGQGPEYSGRVLFADLQVPAAIYDRQPPGSFLYGGENLAELLPPRSRTSHKGDHGHVLLIGGDYGMAGAIRMAAEAAARCGAGLTTVATRSEHAAVQAALRPEIMFRGVASGADLEPLLARASVIAIGPGLGTDDWGRRLLATVLAQQQPLVMDADGLNLLAQSPVQRYNWVLTPHPGEAARLLGQDSAQIQADRLQSCQQLSQRYGAAVVLKGAGSIIAQAGANASPSICQAGNPGMASGGMGDVLTGVIAALLAQRLPLFEATRAGAYIHAWAADQAARDGERGLLATDLLAYLRQAVNPA